MIHFLKKRPKYRIIKHSNHEETYYTLEYRGILWGWNVVKHDICMDLSGCYRIPKKFNTIEDVHNYIDFLKPEIIEVIEEIY